MTKTKTLLSWNIQFGKTNTRQNGYTPSTRLETELDNLLQATSLQNLTALACQEVDRYQKRSQLNNQPTEIWNTLRKYGFQWASYAPTYLGLNIGIRLRPATFFPLTWQRLMPASGVFLALKEKPLQAQFLPLQKSPVRWHNFHTKALKNLAWWHPFKLTKGKPIFGESRVALIAETNSTIYATTHLEIHPETAEKQLVTLLTYLQKLCDETRKDTYLLGDFNLEAKTVTRIITQLKNENMHIATTPSFPVVAPKKSIDYCVYIRPWGKIDSPTTTAFTPQMHATSLKSPISDHSPVLITLEK
ncbi:endonuclease/exonuclease/phosphatase family protein [Gleimia coleocanis DSM 15436]|uniref:Endonuclease/exonuclease/phosphatase family protein n=1 Tax=Gleimia coleocanis DSM 15436 TaxID=525245 RepID=C0VYT5_9ACTO|nr:hypothetical protein [Gleimia coleocanis]EEH64588.1 endonuclease/exonuclease/phosphatase family protein [Gleimia coleocanis DSM 15436]